MNIYMWSQCVCECVSLYSRLTCRGQCLIWFKCRQAETHTEKKSRSVCMSMSCRALRHTKKCCANECYREFYSVYVFRRLPHTFCRSTHQIERMCLTRSVGCGRYSHSYIARRAKKNFLRCAKAIKHGCGSGANVLAMRHNVRRSGHKTRRHLHPIFFIFLLLLCMHANGRTRAI